MEKQIRYTLGKAERLKSRKVIGQIFKDGRSVNIFPFRVIFLHKLNATESIGGRLQAGFTVSSRHFKRAVDRNRIRRMMKESYRLQKHPLSKHVSALNINLSIFVIYVGKEMPVYALVTDKTSLILQRLIELISERK